MKKHTIGMLLPIGIIVLTGCSGGSSSGNINAPGHGSITGKDAIFIAHHYPENACSLLKDDHPDWEVHYAKKEYHCNDYGRADDGNECGEEDYRSQTGITTPSDCISAADDMRAEKNFSPEEPSPTSHTSLHDAVSDIL